MTRTVAALCVTLLLAFWVAACGGDGTAAPTPTALPDTPASTPATATPSPAPTPTPVATEAATPTPSPSPAATATASPAATATASPAAAATPEEEPPLPDQIREILEDVADVRGLEAPPTLRALTIARRDVRDTYVDLFTVEERLRIGETTQLYRLLGYLDEDEHLWDITLSFLDAVLGFYSPEHKTLWVVTEGEGVGLGDLDRGERRTLAHEILHALQDYQFDLDATYSRVEDVLDAELAFTAVVEGDAVVHTDRYTRQYLAAPAGGGLFLVGALHQLPDIPPAVIRELYFPYTTGADAVRHILREQGVEALNGYLAEPLPATTLILHPELLGTGWEPEWIPDSFLLREQVRESLGPGWELRLTGWLGEFHLLNYLLGDAPYYSGWLRAPGNQTAVEAAEGWAGDRYYLFGKGQATVMAVRVRFAVPEDAREFAEAHRAAATAGARVVQRGELTLATQENGTVIVLVEPAGREVVFVIGTSAEVALAALEPLLKG